MEILEIRAYTVATLILLAVNCFAEELTLSVNFRRPVSLSSEKFLSFTVDPETFLHPDRGLSKDLEKSIRIAQALAPAYIRLGGPTSNTFELNEITDTQTNDNESSLFSESNWNRTREWIERTGLDLITCISPENVKTFSENIPSFHERMGYKTNWQLGYECQTRCNISASELGKRIARLREILNENPEYTESIITGPDVISWETKQQQTYLQNYLSYAAPALSAITWHPDDKICNHSSDFDTTHMDSAMFSTDNDNLAMGKEKLYRAIGHVIGDRPLWIAESKKESEKDKFIGALAWAKKLGSAAKLNIDVIMRQLSDMTATTPDFWVSVLHKQLVGRIAFDVKLQSNYKDQVYIYCHCTKESEWYEKGSITIFGLNLLPDDITVQLKNHKITTLHQYILTAGFDADNKLLSKDVILNNENLSLINDTYVPSIKPEILVDRRGLYLDLPPNAIGFWVLPELKIRSCMEDGEHTNERIVRSKTGKSRINIGLPENDDIAITQSGSVENRKSLVKRRTKQHNLQDDDKTERTLTKRDIRRELTRLKKFVGKKLEYYQDKHVKTIEGLSGSLQEKGDRNEDIETRLRMFKERLIELQNSGKMNNDSTIGGRTNKEVLSKTLVLITRIEHSIESMRSRFGESKRITPRVRDRLRSLYDLLKRTNPEEVNDSSETGKEMHERVRRDLDGSADQLTVRKEAAKTRLRTEQARRNDRKLKRKDDIRREVQPSPLERRASDSGENDFYGFFRQAPAKDFPEGDVFLSTGDSAQNNDYDYVRDEDYSSDLEKKTTVKQQTGEGTGHQIQSEDTWLEEDNHGYTPNEFFENIKINNYSVKETVNDNAELSEVEQLEPGVSEEAENGDSQEESEEEILKEENRQVRMEHGDQKIHDYKESFGSKLPSLRSSIRARQVASVKPVYFNHPLLKSARPRLPFQLRSIRKVDTISGGNENIENLEFPVGVYDNTQHKRTKRKKGDLTTILDQEMINEDDRNSKDCRCRVIRKLDEDSNASRRRRDIEQAGIPDKNVKDNLDNEDTIGLILPVEAADLKSTGKGIMVPEILTMEALEPNTPAETGPVIVEEQLLPDTESQSETPETNFPDAIETTAESRIADDTANVTYSVESSTVEHLENPRNARQLNEEITESPPDESLINKNIDLLMEEANLHNETQFFRETPPSLQTATTFNPIEDVPRNATDVQESNASTNGSFLQEKTNLIQENVEDSRSEIRSSTIEPVPRNEEEDEISRGQAESDDKDRSTTGTLKREAPSDETTPVHITESAAEQSDDATVGTTNEENKKRHCSKSRHKGNERAEEMAKVREARLMARAKAIVALRKENDSRKGRKIMQIPSSSQESTQTRERQKKRVEQIERLRSKLREKREKMLQQYEKEILDIVDKIDDEEKRNLKRREALERLGTNDDFKNMIEREKLAYVLMYNPAEYSLIKRDTFSSRPLSVEYVARDGISQKRGDYRQNGRYFDDAKLIEYPSSYLQNERIRQSSSRKEGEKFERHSSNHRKSSGTYYAVIESLSNPHRHSHKSYDHQKGYIQERPSLHCRNGHCREYPSGYYTEGLSDDDSDSIEDDRSLEENRPHSGRKLYIIDPSTYRGGEPILELHESPLKSTKVSSTKVAHSRKRSYSPQGYNSGRNNQEESEKAVYLLGIPTSQEKVKKHNNGLLGLLLNPTRRASTKRSNNSILALNDRKAIKETQTANNSSGSTDTNATGEIPDGKARSEKEVLGGTLVTPDVAKNTESYQDTVIPGIDELKVESNTKTQGSADGKSIRRRRSTDSQTKRRNFKRVPSSALRSKAMEKRKDVGSYLCYKEDSNEASQEDPTVLYKLVKEDDHYKAIPTRNSRTRSKLLSRKRIESEMESEQENDRPAEDSIVGKSFDEYARLMNLDENGSSSEETNSKEYLHIFLPSLAQNGYSPIKFLRNPASYIDESFVDEALDDSYYTEASESQEDESTERYSSQSSSKAELHDEDSSTEFQARNERDINGRSAETELVRRYTDAADHESNSEEMSQEYSDLEDAIVSDKYGILMVLPRNRKRHTRHRRHAVLENQSESGENSGETTLSSSNEHLKAVSNKIDDTNESNTETNYLDKRKPKKEYVSKKNSWKNRFGMSNDASFVSKTVPKLEDVVVSGLEKAQNLTDSVEQLIDDIGQRFNETSVADNEGNNDYRMSHNIYHSMILNVKKFFTFLGGVTRILHG